MVTSDGDRAKEEAFNQFFDERLCFSELLDGTGITLEQFQNRLALADFMHDISKRCPPDTAVSMSLRFDKDNQKFGIQVNFTYIGDAGVNYQSGRLVDMSELNSYSG